jgi:hypothetical protein
LFLLVIAALPSLKVYILVHPRGALPVSRSFAAAMGIGRIKAELKSPELSASRPEKISETSRMMWH